MLSQKKGVYPFQHLEMDFTEIQPSKTYQYLLVVVYTFTGWVEAYPTHLGGHIGDRPFLPSK
jgi:hypothetical protein